MGNDAAGSIRIPCHFCGVYGFKPTSERITALGVQGNCNWQRSEGKVEIVDVAGPMGHCIDDLVEVTKILFSQDVFQKDVLVPHIPFNVGNYENIQKDPSKLRLGYFMYDGLFYPCKTVRRSMDATVEK